ncbi:MAG: hypothetical protein ACRDT2_06500 [Natronosporangium sp.]
MGEAVEVDRGGYRPPSGLPARGYSWEPFTDGNTVAQRHGAYSPRRVEPRAAELVDQVLADPGTAYLQASRWRAAVWAWARAETRVELLTEYLADHVGGAGLDAEGDISPALRALGKWESIALHHRSRLGLDPLSAARLGRDTAAGAVDMARLLSGLDGDQRKPAESDAEGRTGPDPTPDTGGDGYGSE